MAPLLASVLTVTFLAAPALPPPLRERFDRVEWTPDRVQALVRRMPKVETHVHLDGALSPETLLRLAREQDYAPLKDLPLAEIRRRVVVDEARESLAAVLKVFETVQPLLKRADAMETAAYELVASAARQGTRYVEVRFAPALHSAAGFPQSAVLDAVLKGLEHGRKDFGVQSAVIVCLIRPPAFVSLEANREMLDLALARRGHGVVGIDLAGDEAAAPLSAYAGLFRRAKEGGLRTTAHAGEVPGSADLETALELGVDRLGHATLLTQKPELLAEVVRRGIPVEVNLTSNLRTGAVATLKEHPVRDWFRSGVAVALSTDDPGVFANDLPGEYLILHRELGFAPAELAAVALQGVDSLFLPQSERRRLRREFERSLEGLLDELAGRVPGRAQAR
ncbi:MAG: adenosine deaminase [Acidobacteria bacterium RBG_16_70_10]|nr:MAG: adenosine deaminase [Acidobacteria bacterium RBG_16_70_10]